MTTTAAQLVSLILRESGVIGQGQIASATDTNDTLTRVNWMIAQWARKRWLIWNLTDVAFVSTGAVSYGVGVGEDFDIERPARLEDGNFMRQIGNAGAIPIDYTPLTLIHSREQYSRIALKTMGTFASAVFYDPSYPVGQVYFWPVPEASIYELHILVKTPLSQFTSLDQVLNMPDEYEAAIHYNGIIRTRAAYRLPADPVYVGLANDALNLIRNANAQIPTLRIPARVVNRRAGYNIYSDGY